jgi:hypothetical protein
LVGLAVAVSVTALWARAGAGDVRAGELNFILDEQTVAMKGWAMG